MRMPSIWAARPLRQSLGPLRQPLRQPLRHPVRSINQLSNSQNPYLAAHASNPVNWHIWNQSTLDLAKQQSKPIFLSVGYRSCHWCHVMNTESFSNPEVAAMLNQNFVPIKIDKEEHPDIGNIYMTYLQATTKSGGWPLNVFLTPNLEPIFGGTYWAGPNVSPEMLKSLNAVPFTKIIEAVNTQWTMNHDECVQQAQSTTQKLAMLVDSKTAAPVDLDSDKIISEAEKNLLSAFDSKHGGYGQAPKFTLPATLKFAVASTNPDVRFSAIKTMDAIYHGGIKDQIGNGIGRYSVSTDWHFPHFEKMLIDQALLLDVALDDPSTYGLANDIVEFLIHGPLRSPEHSGWYSGLDADSKDSQSGESREGEYYTWTIQEFEQAFKGAPLLESDICALYYGVEPKGNINADLDPHGDFSYKNILSVYKSIPEIAKTFGRSPQSIASVIERGKQRLLDWRRDNKTPPRADTKFVNSWNGLAIGALARASVVLDRADALSVATETAKSIYRESWHKEFSRAVDSRAEAVSDDYAYMIHGLLDFYEARPHSKILKLAMDLQEQQIDHFWDPRGGFFQSRDYEWLIFRPKSGFDSAEPSSNGVSLRNLWRLGCMTSNIDYIHKSQQLVDAFSADIEHQPNGYLSMLRTIPRLPQAQCAAIVAEGPETEELVAKARGMGVPFVLVNKNSVHLVPKLAHLWTDKQDSFIELVDTQ